MRSIASWTGELRALVENERDAAFELDLPADMGGGGQLPSAVELAGMSLAGCICTLFAWSARQEDIDLAELKVMTYLEKPRSESTFTAVIAEVTVRSEASEEALLRCLDQTALACPMVNLFKQAGVDLELELVSD